MGEMNLLNTKGDTTIMWNPDNEDEVRVAEKTFNGLMGKNYVAFRLRSDGEKGQKITEFDKDAERVILIPFMVGG